MTDRPRFEAMFELLVWHLRLPLPPVETVEQYHAELQDLDAEYLDMAAERFRRRPATFPTPAQWRALAGRIEGERADQLARTLAKLPEPLCQRCGDRIWIEVGGKLTEARWSYCGCMAERRAMLLGKKPWPLAKTA